MEYSEYLESILPERREVFTKLRNIIVGNIHNGFIETVSMNGIDYAVPHSIYPNGYHCNPKEPLPFMGLSSNKNSIMFYNMAVYQDERLKNWFIQECKKAAKHKIDIGKSCIRFKYLDEIPFDAISELVKKISMEEWIDMYEKTIKQ